MDSEYDDPASVADAAQQESIASLLRVRLDHHPFLQRIRQAGWQVQVFHHADSVQALVAPSQAVGYPLEAWIRHPNYRERWSWSEPSGGAPSRYLISAPDVSFALMQG